MCSFVVLRQATCSLVVNIVGIGSSRNRVIALLSALALYLAPQASAASTACLHPSPSARPATLVSNFFFRVESTLSRLSIAEVVINYCRVRVGSTPIAEVGHKHCGRPNDNIIHMITRSISLTWFYEIYNVNDGKWKKLLFKKRSTEILQIAIIQMHTRLWFVPASHALSTMSIWITSETFTSSRRILSSKPSDRRRFL